jgi:pimeloyl-ACP methyl ester carboxylesterase
MIREQIVFARTADGITLEGAFIEPVGMEEAREPLLWLHGQHLAFSEPEYVALARVMAAMGRPVLLANTRGKGFGSWHRTASSVRLGGSGWELFQESLGDIAAWIDALHERREGRRIVLAGHGYGGTKAVYYCAQRRDPRVLALIAASTGSLVRDTLDPKALELAERMVADGKGNDLLPFGTLRGSMQATVSARAYVNRVQVNRDLHGSAEVPPALARVTCPIFAFFGALEQTSQRDVSSFLETIVRNATASPLVERALIPGASYFFNGAEAAVAEHVERFLARLPNESAVAVARRRRSA